VGQINKAFDNPGLAHRTQPLHQFSAGLGASPPSLNRFPQRAARHRPFIPQPTRTVGFFLPAHRRHAMCQAIGWLIAAAITVAVGAMAAHPL